MSQSTLTDFFSVRRKAPDQHAAKRRKVILDNDNQQKDSTVLPEVVETTIDKITSATDEHAILPKTPATTDRDASENTRQSKRSSRETGNSPSATDPAKFTVGSSRTNTSAKKQLDWKKETNKPKRNVGFTKLSAMSPKKKTPSSILEGGGVNSTTGDTVSEFKVPTPVKELIGARRVKERADISKNLFQDETSGANEEKSGARGKPKRSTVAQLDRASENVLKLTPQELKEKLGKVTSLKDLKAKLTSLKADAGKLDQLKERRSARIPPPSPTKTGIEILVPASPSKVSRVPPVGGEKVSPRKVPAYERYAYLTRPVSKTLVLPYNYRMLAEVFRSTDTVVSMLFNRREPIIFSKLAKAVQDMMRKNFGEKFLKQIKCVFPQAYLYAWEKVLNKFGQKKDEYQLRISPNLDFKKDILTEYGASDIDAMEKKSADRLTPELLVERRGIFHNSLLQLVKDQHRTFLGGLNPPILVNDGQLTRWHKSFDVESCREIDTVELPPKPNVGEKLTTAQEVLEKANQIFNINPKLAESLQDAAAKIQEGSAPAPAPAPVAAQPPVPKALKGINPKLLEMIRAKEANKARVEMTRDHGEIKKIKQLKRLPQLARLTRSLFISERKVSLTQEFVVKKLVQSYPGSVESSLILEDLRALCVESDGWLVLHLVRNTEFVKLDGSKDINTVTTILETKIKKAEAV